MQKWGKRYRQLKQKVILFRQGFYFVYDTSILGQQKRIFQVFHYRNDLCYTTCNVLGWHPISYWMGYKPCFAFASQVSPDWQGKEIIFFFFFFWTFWLGWKKKQTCFFLFFQSGQLTSWKSKPALSARHDYSCPRSLNYECEYLYLLSQLLIWETG